MTYTPLTGCDKCCFCIVDDDDDKQIGCKVDRLDKFSEKTMQDNGRYVIHRLCNYYRSDEWYEKNRESLKESLSKETEVPLTFFIDKNSSENIRPLIDSIIPHLTHKNDRVIIADSFSGYKAEHIKYKDLISENKLIYIKAWKSKGFKEQYFKNQAILKAKNGFIVLCNSKTKIPDDIKSRVHYFLNEDLGLFLVLDGEDYDYKIVSASVLRPFLDYNIDLYESLMTSIKNSELEKLIIKWSDICPNYV